MATPENLGELSKCNWETFGILGLSPDAQSWVSFIGMGGPEKDGSYYELVEGQPTDSLAAGVYQLNRKQPDSPVTPLSLLLRSNWHIVSTGAHTDSVARCLGAAMPLEGIITPDMGTVIAINGFRQFAIIGQAVKNPDTPQIHRLYFQPGPEVKSGLEIKPSESYCMTNCHELFRVPVNLSDDCTTDLEMIWASLKPHITGLMAVRIERGGQGRLLECFSRSIYQGREILFTRT